MTDAPETFTGPYSYLDMTFEEQNKALKINNPNSPGYVPAACYLIGTRGTVKLWTKPTGEAEQFSTPVDELPPGYNAIGGGYSFAELRVGLVVRNPAGKEIYCQPGDDATTMRANIDALDEISEDVTDTKRATIADMALAEYFA